MDVFVAATLIGAIFVRALTISQNNSTCEEPTEPIEPRENTG